MLQPRHLDSLNPFGTARSHSPLWGRICIQMLSFIVRLELAKGNQVASVELPVKQSFCRLCGATSDFKFDLPLVSGLTGRYYECRRCQFLRSDHLDDAAALRIVYSNTLGEA